MAAIVFGSNSATGTWTVGGIVLAILASAAVVGFVLLLRDNHESN